MRSVLLCPKEKGGKGAEELAGKSRDRGVLLGVAAKPEEFAELGLRSGNRLVVNGNESFFSHSNYVSALALPASAVS